MNILKNKVLKILLVTYLISIVLGFITYFIIDSTSINANIINYFKSFNNSFNYLNGFINTFSYNLNYTFFIWISGLLVIGLLISPIIVFLKGLSLGITLISIIVTFKIKGLIIAFIVLISNIILYDTIYILLSYYSINLSLKTIKVLKENKQINLSSFYKNYILRYLILLIILILTSILDIYVISNIIKYIII